MRKQNKSRQKSRTSSTSRTVKPANKAGKLSPKTIKRIVSTVVRARKTSR